MGPPNQRSVACLFLGPFLLLSSFASGEDWKQAAPGYRFEFPRDHASHPEYKIEWWYYTGNLDATDGRRFGYQLTFFRVGTNPKPENPSRWSVRDLFMTHLAVTDIDGRRYAFRERINRAAIGWAGAATDEYRVWNEDWEARLDSSGKHILSAIDQDIGLKLEMEPGKTPVVHGVDGISQKGSTPGNASHYYSLTRMPTRGILTFNGEAVEVTGSSWMDHEFSTSFLEKHHMGWDWFSIQLDDGTDLMFFQLRGTDGSRSRESSGTIVDRSGRALSLQRSDFTLQTGALWQSPASGARYPIEWRVQIPGQSIGLVVRAALEDQELRTEQSTGVTYWEGSIEVTGTNHGRSVRGRGYLEMTGYAGTPMGTILD